MVAAEQELSLSETYYAAENCENGFKFYQTGHSDRAETVINESENSKAPTNTAYEAKIGKNPAASSGV